MTQWKLQRSFNEILTDLFGHPLTFLLSLVSVSSVVSYFWYARYYSSPQKCLGAPFLYATTHHEVSNILKYSRDGCLLSSEVLFGGPIEFDDHLSELRSIAVGQYKGEESLYVADATSADSYLLLYGGCDPSGKRQYLKTVVSTDVNPGADHTYGIAFDNDGNIYASFQHTDNVLKFSKDTLEPASLPDGISFRAKEMKYFPGTFYQFGRVGVHRVSEQGIRSIAVVGETLWVANEDLSGVVIVDLKSGITTNIIVITNPIGLHYDKERNLVFVGSKQKHWGGAVHAIDPVYLKIVKSYTTNRMNHPSGIVTHENTLYVAEQILGVIMTFDINSGAFLSKIVKKTPGQIEQLALSDC
jgi:hypothetical protein